MSNKPTENGADNSDLPHLPIAPLIYTASDPISLWREARERNTSIAVVLSEIQHRSEINMLPHNCANCFWQCSRPNKDPYRINRCGRWVPDHTIPFAQWQRRAAGSCYGPECTGCIHNSLEYDYARYDFPMDGVRFHVNQWGGIAAECQRAGLEGCHGWIGSSDYLHWIKTVKIPIMIRMLPDPASYDLESLLREALFQHPPAIRIKDHPEYDILL